MLHFLELTVLFSFWIWIHLKAATSPLLKICEGSPLNCQCRNITKHIGEVLSRWREWRLKDLNKSGYYQEMCQQLQRKEVSLQYICTKAGFHQRGSSGKETELGYEITMATGTSAVWSMRVVCVCGGGGVNVMLKCSKVEGIALQFDGFGRFSWRRSKYSQ